MVLIFNRETTWLYDESKFTNNYNSLTPKDYKDAYISQFDNNRTSSETINRLHTISRYFFVGNDYTLVELTKDETISAYQGFHGRMPMLETKRLYL